jgi:hypothetical protein
MELKFIKHTLSKCLLERFLLFSAAADKLAATTDLTPSGCLSQGMTIFDVFDGIAYNGPGDLFLFWEFVFSLCSIDQWIGLLVCVRRHLSIVSDKIIS